MNVVNHIKKFLVAESISGVFFEDSITYQHQVRLTYHCLSPNLLLAAVITTFAAKLTKLVLLTFWPHSSAWSVGATAALLMFFIKLIILRKRA